MEQSRVMMELNSNLVRPRPSRAWTSWAEHQELRRPVVHKPGAVLELDTNPLVEALAVILVEKPAPVAVRKRAAERRVAEKAADMQRAQPQSVRGQLVGPSNTPFRGSALPIAAEQPVAERKRLAALVRRKTQAAQQQELEQQPQVQGPPEVSSLQTRKQLQWSHQTPVEQKPRQSGSLPVLLPAHHPKMAWPRQQPEPALQRLVG